MATRLQELRRRSPPPAPCSARCHGDWPRISCPRPDADAVALWISCPNGECQLDPRTCPTAETVEASRRKALALYNARTLLRWQRQGVGALGYLVAVRAKARVALKSTRALQRALGVAEERHHLVDPIVETLVDVCARIDAELQALGVASRGGTRLTMPDRAFRIMGAAGFQPAEITRLLRLEIDTLARGAASAKVTCGKRRGAVASALSLKRRARLIRPRRGG